MKKVFMTAVVLALFCTSCSLEEVDPVKTDNVDMSTDPDPKDDDGKD